jgi:hypothetical protein
MTLTSGAASFSPIAKTQAEGQDAQQIDDQSLKSRQQLESSVTLGSNLEAFQKELTSVLAECSVGNWDGYSALPLVPEVVEAAIRFANVIPLGICRPSVGADPDGSLTFEWYVSPERLLSVSIDALANVHFAAVLGDINLRGTEPFVGVVPNPLLNLIYRVIG